MKRIATYSFAIFLISATTTIRQKPASKPKIIFAVFDNGETIEPVAKLENGKLLQVIGGEESGLKMPDFGEMYYKPSTVYNLIYGGKQAGKITVIKNDPSSECGALMADVKMTSANVKLKGFEMALATDIRSTKPTSGIRRAAYAAEKAELQKIVIAELQKKKIPVKKLKLVKLTALDADNDKINEMVGTYTTAPSAKERELLFFIAVKSPSGNYVISYSEIKRIKEERVMSGEISSIDEGVYQELLLDVLDTDNSGSSKIFTMTLSFKGAGFNAYQRIGTKWKKVLDASNYHCGY